MRSRPPFHSGRIHVQERECDTCVFRAGNLMQLNPGRLAGMVREAREEPNGGGNIPCHETTHGQARQIALCRGWYDRHGRDSWVLRLAVAMNMIVEVPVG